MLSAVVIARDISGVYHVIAGKLDNQDPFTDAVDEMSLLWMLHVRGASEELILEVFSNLEVPTASVALLVPSEPGAEMTLLVLTAGEGDGAPADPSRYVWDRLTREAASA